MRQEITMAIDRKRRTLAQKSSLRSPEAQGNMDTLHSYFDKLTACLKASPQVIDVYAGTATATNIHWDDDRLHHVVVIELTPYGPLAALFAYGPADEGLLEHIDSCIEGAGLLKLTEHEIKQLQEQNAYYELFSG